MEATHPSGPGGADAGAGGAAAPPGSDERNRAPTGLTREYRSAGIRVQWYADRCIHSAECIRALSRVFDPRRRPWIVLDAASVDEVARAVELCPTGALHYLRLDGGPQETVPERVEVQTVPDGPLYIRGRVRVTGENGELIHEDSRMALCRCGRSQHMPFCDNSHRATAFRDPGRIAASDP